jgi:hypothetical protein
MRRGVDEGVDEGLVESVCPEALQQGWMDGWIDGLAAEMRWDEMRGRERANTSYPLISFHFHLPLRRAAVTDT